MYQSVKLSFSVSPAGAKELMQRRGLGHAGSAKLLETAFYSYFLIYRYYYHKTEKTMLVLCLDLSLNQHNEAKY